MAKGRTKNDGRGRLGGRAKGTPNKVTKTMREWLDCLVNGQRAQIKKDLKALQPYERLKMIERFMQYTTPKQTAISGDVGINFDSLTDEQLTQFIERLTNGV